MPVSAVGSNNAVTSRFFKGRKRDALDEIEGWISDSKSEFGRGNSSRVSAQPPKNITEQKMLDAKLFEMSKQRYNFILHSKWQQKVFMEKQKQKTSVMKDLLKNVNLGKVVKSGNQIDRNAKRLQLLNRKLAYNMSNCVTSEGSKTFDNFGTTSDIAVTEPNERQRRLVTFVTERPNKNTMLPQISDYTKSVIDAVQSANLQDDVVTDIKQRNIVELPHIDKQQQYVLLRKDERWPVKDLRFVKLSAALSNNFPRKQLSVA